LLVAIAVAFCRSLRVIVVYVTYLCSRSTNWLRTFLLYRFAFCSSI